MLKWFQKLTRTLTVSEKCKKVMVINSIRSYSTTISYAKAQKYNKEANEVIKWMLMVNINKIQLIFISRLY